MTYIEMRISVKSKKSELVSALYSLLYGTIIQHYNRK